MVLQLSFHFFYKIFASHENKFSNKFFNGKKFKSFNFAIRNLKKRKHGTNFPNFLNKIAWNEWLEWTAKEARLHIELSNTETSRNFWQKHCKRLHIPKMRKIKILVENNFRKPHVGQWKNMRS